VAGLGIGFERALYQTTDRLWARGLGLWLSGNPAVELLNLARMQPHQNAFSGAGRPWPAPRPSFCDITN